MGPLSLFPHVRDTIASLDGLPYRIALKTAENALQEHPIPKTSLSTVS